MRSLKGNVWRVLSKDKSSKKDIIKILFKNRGIVSIKSRKDFINPRNPSKISIKATGIGVSELKKALSRVDKAIKNKEKILIYGDYDADGISATAILWEAIYSKYKNVIPYIPDRFADGYGINKKTLQKILKEDSEIKLIITVDNGIVAFEAADFLYKAGVELIISDHHEKGKKIPKAKAIVHTTKLGGAGIAWLIAREFGVSSGLDLAALGTVADQIPLYGVNRSIVKYGLEELEDTKRLGLAALFKDSKTKFPISTFTIGYVIAPRINAMGRLAHGIDSLRLLCTKNIRQAEELSKKLSKVNHKRQEVVTTVLSHVETAANASSGFVVVSHESYHEGVIGLAASKLVEEHYRPAIVISRGKELSKASARSIPGVNIIEVLRKLEGLTESLGGHAMAAGFSIKNKNLEKFEEELSGLAVDFLTPGIIKKVLDIDMVLGFDELTIKLMHTLKQFEPFGSGNFTPVFLTKGVEIVNVRTVGSSNGHLKLKLQEKDKSFDAIGFGMGEFLDQVSIGDKIDIVYNLEENVWNGNWSMQLNVKDINLSSS